MFSAADDNDATTVVASRLRLRGWVIEAERAACVLGMSVGVVDDHNLLSEYQRSTNCGLGFLNEPLLTVEHIGK